MSGQFLFTWNAELAETRTSGHNHCTGLNLGIIRELDTIGRFGGIIMSDIHAGDIQRDEFGAETLGLGLHIVHQIGAKNTFREAGEILHFRGVDQLTAWRQGSGDQYGVQAGTPQVNRSGVSCRS